MNRGTRPQVKYTDKITKNYASREKEIGKKTNMYTAKQKRMFFRLEESGHD
jgi:hypothetical protein